MTEKHLVQRRLAQNGLANSDFMLLQYAEHDRQRVGAGHLYLKTIRSGPYRFHPDQRLDQDGGVRPPACPARGES